MTGKKSLPPLDMDVLETLASDKRRTYSPTRHPVILKRLAGLGLNDKQIAQFLDITQDTLISWRNKYQVVRRALENARLDRDLKVVDALYQRAIGYEHEHDDIRVAGGEVVITPVKKHVQPDVRAQEIWLYNRMPEQWKSRSAIELTGKDGGPVQTSHLTFEQAQAILAAHNPVDEFEDAPDDDEPDASADS